MKGRSLFLLFKTEVTLFTFNKSEFHVWEEAGKSWLCTVWGSGICIWTQLPKNIIIGSQMVS